LGAKGEMPLSWIILAEAVSSGSNSSSSIITFSYIVGSIAAIVGIVGGLHKYYSKQKQRWIEDGVTRANQAQVIEQNTHAVTELTSKFDDFTVNVRSELTNVRTDLTKVADRVTHLERRKPSA
jgi:hypothetical protein